MRQKKTDKKWKQKLVLTFYSQWFLKLTFTKNFTEIIFFFSLVGSDHETRQIFQRKYSFIVLRSL